MKIIKYSEFILEKSIGSEAIRMKHYADLDKSKYYEIINIDPTSIRKKDFSKPGKYSKWLLYQYKIGFLSDYLLRDKDYVATLTDYLFIFSTNWYSSKYKKSNYFIGGEKNNLMINDINNFSLSNFYSKLRNLRDEYLVDTEVAKFDVVYSDDKFDIYVPLNFTASRESAQNTQWCSLSFSGYSNWNKVAILFRIIPKDNSLDKIKLTYKYDGNWYMAGPKYPELIGIGDPFENVDNVPKWLVKKNDIYEDSYDSARVVYDGIEKTMNLLSNEGISCIKKYYDLNKK